MVWASKIDLMHDLSGPNASPMDLVSGGISYLSCASLSVTLWPFEFWPAVLVKHMLSVSYWRRILELMKRCQQDFEVKSWYSMLLGKLLNILNKLCHLYVHFPINIQSVIIHSIN
jgi:hypothetical protein